MVRWRKFVLFAFVFFSCQRASLEKVVKFTANNDTSSLRDELSKGFDPKSVNDFGEQLNLAPLHIAAQNGNVDAAELLLSAGIDINLFNKMGLTALMTAAGAGKNDMIEFLVKKGAEVSRRSTVESGSHTALSMAAEMNRQESALKLLSLGEGKNQGIEKAIAGAAAAGNLDLVKVLLEKCRICISDVAADMARSKGHVEVAEFLDSRDPAKQHLHNLNALNTEAEKLEGQLKAFLDNATRTGILDRKKLAEYESRLKAHEDRMKKAVAK